MPNHFLLLNRDLIGNQLNGSLTIPANVGQDLQYVSLQNNQLTNLNQLNNPNVALKAQIM